MEPAPTKPAPTEPAPTEPAPTEPAPTEPAPTEPAPTEPAPTEPAPTEPAPTEPAPTEPAPTEPAPTEPAPTEPAPTEPAPTEPAPTEPAPTEPAEDEKVKKKRRKRRMAYTPTKKMKGVGYFHHFPKNFLKPYRRAEPHPSHNVALSRLRPEGCEWLRQPHVATSELSSTVNDNMPVLMQDDQLLDAEKIQKLTRNLEPLALLLQQPQMTPRVVTSSFKS
ncbi:proteoglycan 4-like [Rhopilema esculentum]|uniref:proteoglycan 4-like n=1 Tax=Rhopilema esculentum TaxID=499914 RepID=UPI0031D63E7D